MFLKMHFIRFLRCWFEDSSRELLLTSLRVEMILKQCIFLQNCSYAVVVTMRISEGIAFMGGLQMPSVWLVALAAIEHTLATKEWAGPATDVGKALHFLGNEIMHHVNLNKGNALSLERTMPVRCSALFV
jgi:hypothetical protein